MSNMPEVGQTYVPQKTRTVTYAGCVSRLLPWHAPMLVVAYTESAFPPLYGTADGSLVWDSWCDARSWHAWVRKHGARVVEAAERQTSAPAAATADGQQ